jgi:hypothetical protein
MKDNGVSINGNNHKPICSMYGIFTYFTYIWVIYGVDVGKYSIHGAYGKWMVYFMDYPSLNG